MIEPEGTYAVVLSTAGSMEEASAIANELVRRRLAACVNLLEGVRSVYRWKETIHDDPEIVMIVKTRVSLYPQVERAIRDLHSYECPEVVLLPVTGGERNYLEWLGQETGG